MEAADFNSVLCFKSQGETSTSPGVEDSDFLLGIQTQFQKEMFIKFSNKLICVDATHGTNSYDFQLITIMVADDFDQGIPVAWLISNRETEAVLSVFFSAIRERCGDTKTDTFMSDDADQYFSAWARSFQKPAKRLICSWHVDRSWRRKLNDCVKDKEVIAEIYGALKNLQNELSESEFRRNVQKFLSWVRGLSIPMAEYFERTYLNKAREWASCYRIGTKANTNMLVESFHRVLKDIYLERKQNRRVDHLLYKLLKIARDKAYEQWIKAEKGKITAKSRESAKRHEKGLQLNVTAKNENEWEVLSLGKSYHVQKMSVEPCPCSLKCPRCDACVHNFSCACMDFAIRGVVCGHIHAASIHSSTQSNTEETNAEAIIDIDIDQKRQRLSELIPKNSERHSSLEDTKKKVMKEIAELVDLVNNAPNVDTLKTVLRHMQATKVVAKGLSLIGNDHMYTKTRQYPPNKLMDKQKRFFSTKCKRKVKRQKLRISEEAAKNLEETEQDVCAFCFKSDPPGLTEDLVEWLECNQCNVWAHEACDYFDGNKDEYICCMCRN